MKRYIRSGILALSLTALPLGLAASAQAGYQERQGYQDRTGTTTSTTKTETGHSDWGWLGLLGLLGLTGLMRRKEEPTHHRASDYRTGETIGSR
jgi:MYXO-CTERM domain-containing protein